MNNGMIFGAEEIGSAKRSERPLDALPDLMREQDLRSILDALPAAVYATDAEGRITYFNQAAADLAGRIPELGLDRWCVTWRLYEPDGTPLPHDRCPMAVALKEGRAVRGVEAVAERPDGTRVPFLPYPTPLRDGSGQVIGAVNLLVDISHLKASEERLRESETRYREIFESAGVAVWEEDFSAVADLLDGLRQEGVEDLRAHLAVRPDRLQEAVARVRIADVNPFTLELFETTEKEELLRSLSSIFLPETTPVFVEELVALWEGRRRFASEAVVRTLKGRRLDVLFTISFEGARFERTYVSILDISRRKAAERRLEAIALDNAQLLQEAEREVAVRREAERAAQQLAAIVESSEDAILSLDLSGVIASWNASAERLYGYTQEETIGKPVTLLLPEDRLGEELEILAQIHTGRRVDPFETTRRAKDGRLIPISLTISPIRDASGAVVGASKIARDITERRRAEEQQELLLREMNHRVKNLFALTSGIVSLTARSAASPQELRQSILDRLSALARAHDLIRVDPNAARNEAARATSLEALLRTIFAAHVEADGGQSRLDLRGPEVPIGGRAITNLALVLHELATNAAKYGALATADGHIDIEWSLVGDQLALSWRERNGPPLHGSPPKEGFGSLLARRSIEDQYGGRLKFDWTPEGLAIYVSIPADRLAT